MSRPCFEVADVLRLYGDSFLKKHPQSKFVLGIINLLKICRTAVLGGHLDRCPACGWEHPSYNSCRNRHCPKCQSLAKEEWMEQRKTELLPVPYFHCVFTLPHEFNPLILQNKAVMLGLLFQSVNETLNGFAREPKWKLEGQPGFIAVLHTWNQELLDHVHLHVILPAGVLRGTEFIRSPEPRFLFPVRALGNVFAAKYRDHLLRAWRKGKLQFHGQLKPLAEEPAFKRLLNSTKKKESWNVYAKRPFGGPEQVFDYLGRYTHRVAISNHRITNIADGNVTFTARDRKKEKTYPVKLEAHEFIRRFLLHILPPRFVKIRFYGFLSHTKKQGALETIRIALNVEPPSAPPEETTAEKIERLTGINVTHCPKCHGALITLELPKARAPPGTP
jgi:hypothetical protein